MVAKPFNACSMIARFWRSCHLNVIILKPEPVLLWNMTYRENTAGGSINPADFMA